MTQDIWLWIAIAAGLALVLAAFLFLRRGQRVDLNIASDSAPSPTLARQRTPEPVIVGPPTIAGPIALAVNAPTADDLRLIKGLGPRIATRLAELGITRFDQLAGLDAACVAEIDAQLGSFAGRITRDNWVDQAAFLAKGDIAGFEAKYGKLDGGGVPS